MNTVLHPFPINRARSARAAAPAGARRPHFDCRDLDDSVEVTVYMPGVDPASVEITTTGPDLAVTGRKARFVRVNFSALHIERVQHDYLLRLRLGRGLNYGDIDAVLKDGVLRIRLRRSAAAPAAARKVA